MLVGDNVKDNYYNNIKQYLIDNEVYARVKDYSKNVNDISTYYKLQSWKRTGVGRKSIWG